MSGESFLFRWSRRKQAVEREDERRAAVREEVPGSRDQDVRSAPVVETVPGAMRTDEEILGDLGLENPDLLGPGDDFRGFMQQAVPEHLRRRALRRLWQSNPVLANLDGLNDYDGDFTGGSTAPGLLRTVYRVGRGLLPETEGECPSGAALGSGSVVQVPQQTGSGSVPLLEKDTNEEQEGLAQTSDPSPQPGSSSAAAKDRDGKPDPGLATVRRRMRFRFS
ncbi:MAG: DUF3306 domain-containing protein [Geminicoccaceae bacterium]|nr:DUF3306 domain-containing protein [Geminicoccaceae bacterium]